MAETLTDAVPQILIKIQDSISTLRSEVGAVRSELGTLRSDLTPRLDRIETIVRKQQRGAAAMMVIMRATVGDFDERVNEVEERLAALEAKQADAT
jgi:hypothetical protein